MVKSFRGERRDPIGNSVGDVILIRYNSRITRFAA